MQFTLDELINLRKLVRVYAPQNFQEAQVAVSLDLKLEQALKTAQAQQLDEAVNRELARRDRESEDSESAD